MLQRSDFLEKLKRAGGDIRTWLAVAFLGRLYGIGNPPLEPAWSSREAEVLMVARNFLEVSPNILYPRLDFIGSLSSITAMEFPFLNYLIYLVSLIAGYDHWYGRLINLSISTVGLFYYYRIVRDHLSQRLAFFSTVLLIFSLWLTYSRKAMPDTFATSLVLIGLYYGSSYLYSLSGSASAWRLLPYSLFAAVGILAKIPAAMLYAIFIIPMMNRSIDQKRKIIFILCSGIILIPAGLWYFYWAPYLSESYGNSFFMGVPILQGLQELLYNFTDRIAFRFYWSAIGYSGFLLFLFGLYHAIRDRHSRLLWIFSIISLTLLAYMLKAGLSFWQANYILPFITVMALVAGYGLTKMRSPRIAALVLLFVCLENIASRQHEFRIPEKHRAVAQLEHFLDQFSERDDRIAINSAPTSIPSYMAHRKGWKVANEDLKRPRFIDMLEEWGCKYIIIMKQAHGRDLILDLPQVANSPHFRAYLLE